MKLNVIFSSNMVFAQGLPIRIYGTGKGEAQITFAEQTRTVVSEAEQWQVGFPPMAYGGPYELIFESNDETVTLTDIYVGEVYLFAGQSNMQFKLNSATEYTHACETHKKLRMFFTDRIEKTEAYYPEDGWQKAEKETVGDWSAVAYLAGKELAHSKDVAVGLISCYQGASVIESWMPKGTLEKNGIVIPLDRKHPDHTSKEYGVWNFDGTLYDYALSQVIPFSLSGVVWYQGESDTTPEEAAVYERELQLMIQAWREDFANPALPFVVIQIADFSFRDDEAWKMVQEAQNAVQHSTPYVTTVICRDVCEKDDIHPPTKGKLAKRVAAVLAAL